MGIEYAKSRELRRLGLIVGCYPMGRGEGLVPDASRKAVLAKAEAEGWQCDPCPCGHDYNFHAAMYRLSRHKYAYTVFDSLMPKWEGRGFDERRDCYNWLIDGLRGTEGAERDHYVSMLLQLEDGKKNLDYNG